MVLTNGEKAQPIVDIYEVVNPILRWTPTEWLDQRESSAVFMELTNGEKAQPNEDIAGVVMQPDYVLGACNICLLRQ